MNGRITFYRAVSNVEMDDILASGRLRQGPNSAEGKHLTGSLDEAIRFAAKLFPSGGYRIIEVEVATNIGEKFFFIGNLDLCGRAWFAEFPDLHDAVVREVKR